MPMPLLNMESGRHRLVLSLVTAARCAVLVFLGCLCGTAGAAELTSLEALGKAIESATLADADRQEGTALLDQAKTDQLETERLRRQINERKTEAAAQPQRVRELEESLVLEQDQAMAAWARRLPAQADAETLERVLSQERSQVAALSTQIDAVADGLALQLSGPAQALDALARLREQWNGLQPMAVAPEAEPRLLTEARRLQQASERDRLQAEIELAELEQSSFDQRQVLQELTLKSLRHRSRLHAARVDLLQQRIALRHRDELSSRLAQLAATEQSLAAAPVLLQDAAAKNRALGRELETGVAALESERLALPLLERARDDVVSVLRDSRARLELGAGTEAVGRWLWSERRRLESPARLRQELEQVNETLAELRLRLILLSEDQRGSAEPGPLVAVQDADNNWSVPRMQTELETLLEVRAELFGLVQAVVQRRIAVLEQKDALLVEQLAQTSEMQTLLDRQLLWTRSHGPINAEWLTRLPIGLGDLFSAERYGTSVRLVIASCRERPLIWLFGILALLLLVQLRGRALPGILAEAAVTRHIRQDSYRATVRSLGWTLVAALPWPAMLVIGGTLFGLIGQAGNFSHSFGQAMLATAAPLFFLQLLRAMVIERGLGQSHFRWRRARRESLADLLPLIGWLVLPLYFLVQLGAARNVDVATDVIARLAIMFACWILAWANWRLMGPGKLWVVRGSQVEASAWRKATRVVGTVLILLVSVLSMAGYVHSAGVLLQALMSTFGAVVVIALVAGLLGRWFLLGERRIALQQHLARQDSGESALVRAELERDVSLAEVNTQTGRLLRALRWTLTVTALIWVWADVLPAFSRLDDIALWQFTDVGEDGKSIVQPVTLMALLLGGLVLVLTLIAARNVPGLVEIGLLSRTSIDAPTRYAVTSLMRYAIVIAGTLVGLGMFGMRWSQLQWLAAALSVGLGFGLQEIFANFVSGLILLFERPFRVGDIITVGEYTGEVTRIRTRATTIQDFDRREIVVPNKQFITGQVTNWTLTDSITRLTIKVSVDGGSDSEQVLKLLRQAAEEQLLVLREPGPQAWFLAYNNGSMDFDLKVFVGSVADRLPVQGALNRRIGELFAANDVHIASPQLGVTILADTQTGAETLNPDRSNTLPR